MLNLIKTLLGGSDHARRLTHNPPPPEVAVCALLLEAAEADHDFTAKERELISRQIQARFGLAESEVEALIAETQRRRAEAGDAWPFTHAIRRYYSPEQKKDLLVVIWRILLSDDTLTAGEAQWARRLRDMVSVNHSVLMDAKRLAQAGAVT